MNGTAPQTESFDYQSFAFHWFCSALGIIFKLLLPMLVLLINPEQPIEFPRFWVIIIIASIGAIVCGLINHSLPKSPTMALNSLAFGVAGFSIVEFIQTL